MIGLFSRKAADRAELLENERRHFAAKLNFKVVGMCVLHHEDYEHLIEHLLEDNDLIKAITDRCGTEEDGTARCFLFRDETRNDEALAINSEGYDYARYTSLIRL